MPTPHPLFQTTRTYRQRGVALVIILAFIVLLTGLVVAFFSRAMSDRQVANASASMQKADLFAQGTIDSIVADLKQEIVDGSTLTNGVYVPKPTTGGNLSTVVPAYVDKSGVVGKVGSGLENLVKQSTNGVPFYPSNSNYGGKSLPSRAANASTKTASQNGRSVSPARWNKPLLMTPKSVSDYTPVTSSVFTPPDWILVARDGSNPTGAWSTSLQTSTANNTSVVGRYAYNIYDEGGLLDMNVAGYPTGSNMTTAPAVPYYKNALACADLTQIPGISSFNTGANPVINTKVDAIVGWRNYASAALNATTSTVTVLGSTFPNYTWTATNGTNYYNNFIQSNSTGFLKTVGSLTSGQSDHAFTSRQQLINLFTQGLGASSSLPLLSSLQYLGTFSRDVNQPAYVPPLYTDPSAPTVQPTTTGGNNQNGLDKKVNPSFLDPIVQAQGSPSFTRNDGSVAKAGDPLVSKRFPLSKLAWITYKGPSATRTMTDADMVKLINTYGVSQSFLLQGTAANIQACFGLTWDVANNRWKYDVHNGGGAPAIPAGGSKGAIMRLEAIASLGNKAHDPDFFELLKASISAGSKAKTSTAKLNSPVTLRPEDYQWQKDVSFDYAIIQIGANIIEQSKVDGYCVRIVFDDGLGAREFQGVENLPYFYRVRFGMLKIRNEKPLSDANTLTLNQPYAVNTGAAKLVDPGVSMLMMLPEIWNPHDQNCPLPDSALGLRPTAFRLLVDTTDPISLATGSNYTNFKVWTWDWNQGASQSWRSDTGAIPGGGTDTGGTKVPFFSLAAGGAGTEITGGYAGTPRTLKSTNPVMTFSIPAAVSGGINTTTLFREPTLLARAGFPATSNLSMDPNWVNADPDYKAIWTTSGVSFSTAAGVSGFKADITNPLNLPTAPAATQAYVGVPVGLAPVQWIHTGKKDISNGDIIPSGGNNIGCTWQLQYLDSSGKWITYDTKYLAPADGFWTSTVRSIAPTGGLMQERTNWACFTDPRTSRFGAPTSSIGSSAIAPFGPPGCVVFTAGGGYGSKYAVSETNPRNKNEWLEASGTFMWLASNRPTTDSGWVFQSGNLFSGQTPISTTTQGWYSPGFAQGLLSQNSTDSTVVDNGFKYSGTFTTTNNANNGTKLANFYTDADGVARRAMGGYVKGSGASPATTTVGLPMAATLTQGGAVLNQKQSRPWVLHRPFRSVAELGYVFSDMPWKNLDFFTPESGDSALLDVFCINDTDNPNGMVAGKVNLNTKQANVLKAILAGAYADEQLPGTPSPNNPSLSQPTDYVTPIVTDSTNGLIARTSSTATGKGPFQNISELVGKWVSKQPITASGITLDTNGKHIIDGSKSYAGFTSDLTSLLPTGTALGNIQRFREAPVRALANVGTTRVWNLMIDVIAQTGRYPGSAKTLDNFVVEGEQRYWVHLAIDRLTGKVIDKQIEVVKE